MRTRFVAVSSLAAGGVSKREWSISSGAGMLLECGIVARVLACSWLESLSAGTPSPRPRRAPQSLQGLTDRRLRPVNFITSVVFLPIMFDAFVCGKRVSLDFPC